MAKALMTASSRRRVKWEKVFLKNPETVDQFRTFSTHQDLLSPDPPNWLQDLLAGFCDWVTPILGQVPAISQA